MIGNRGGKKLRSGRPSLVDEQAVERLLSKSRAYIERMLFSDDAEVKALLPEEVKFEAALRLVIKSIPQAVSAQVTEVKYQEIIHRLEGLTTGELLSLINAGRTRALPAGTT